MPENRLIRAVSDERLHYPCHRDQSEIGAIQIVVNEENKRPPTQLEIDKLLVLMAQLSKRAQQQKRGKKYESSNLHPCLHR
ncbi:hypothetical protein ACFLYO_11645 [Chloroflexota bacterium]